MKETVQPVFLILGAAGEQVRSITPLWNCQVEWQATSSARICRPGSKAVARIALISGLYHHRPSCPLTPLLKTLFLKSVRFRLKLEIVALRG